MLNSENNPTNKKIYVAGHTGMVGSAIVRLLKSKGENEIITRTSSDLDLRDIASVDEFFESQKPQVVYLAAAKVGGIIANQNQSTEFLHDNTAIASNVISSSHKHGVEKLLFLGSSCIYPKHAQQPIKESALLTGPLEPTNEFYALAKIFGLKLCDAYRQQYGCNFISAMPTNLYGPGDNYHPENSHVLPAMIRRFNEAVLKGDSEVKCWGSGYPKREFLHVDDLAEACLFLMQNYNDGGWVNVGSGDELSIKELAEIIAEIAGYQGEITWDTSKPDGTPRKLLDENVMKSMGWQSSIPLVKGIHSVYEKYTSENIS